MEDLLGLLRDVDFREAVAEQAYLRERAEEAAVDAEHDTSGEFAYFCLSWDALSDSSRKPYRTAAAMMADCIAELHAAA